MIADRRRRLTGRRRPATGTPAGNTIHRTVDLKAYLVSVEGHGMAAVFGVACKPTDDPVETVKTVQGFTDQPGMTFDVIPAEGLCVHLAGDLSVDGPRS